ncbi:hypothetical protein [Microaerobacter geothermalis]
MKIEIDEGTSTSTFFTQRGNPWLKDFCRMMMEGYSRVQANPAGLTRYRDKRPGKKDKTD